MDTDTDIDNYEIEDLYNIYKIKQHEEPDISALYDKTITTIKKIRDNLEMEDITKREMYVFFKECFYKICAIKALKKKLHINTKKYEEEEEKKKQKSQISEDNRIREPLFKEYPASLPEPVSNTYSVSVNTDKYVRGTLNPLKRETITNIFTISSKFRENSKYTTTTDFTIDINNVYNNVVSMKLASVELMNSYYPFSKYLNTDSFSVRTYHLQTSTGYETNITEKEIVIREGIYNTTTLTEEINTRLAADAATLMVITQYDFMKGKLYFYLDATASPVPAPGYEWAFDLNFAVVDDIGRPLYYNMGWLMGYRKTQYKFAEDYNPTLTNVLEIGFNPEATAEVAGTKFYMLEVDDFNKNNPEVFKYNLDSKTSFNINNVLAKIPNTSEPFAIIFEDSSDKVFKTRQYFGPVRISKLRIRLLDDNGRIIDLNSSEIIISLEIETLEVPYKNMVYK